MNCRCDDGWVCEAHPDQPHGHDDCQHAGIPCPICQVPGETPRLPKGWRSLITGPPQERGSVRPVTIEGDPDARTFYCEVRTLPHSGLKPGDIVWVEFGATWATMSGRQEKVDGQWRQAIVMAGAPQGSGVHLRLSPDPSTAPTELG